MKGSSCAHQTPTEVRERAIRLTLLLLDFHPAMRAAYRELTPKLSIATETLRKWVTQADAGTGTGTGTGKPLEVACVGVPSRNIFRSTGQW